MKTAGILMPVSSFPSEHGIGDFGKSSYEFIDRCKKSGVKIWQILPLNPLGYGNSPYQPYSSFAGDELYISLDLLKEEGLLTEIEPIDQKESNHIDYAAVREYKGAYLAKAFEQFHANQEYEKFIQQEWVYLYAVYITFKKANDLKCWNEWKIEHQEWILNTKNKAQKNQKEESQNFLLKPYERDIAYEMFLQFIFYKQWIQLKKYANAAGIQVMGDMPFYVGIDSLDVWANQECFLLDEKGFPTFIAGVPPDYFSETGQRWGNPIYDWEYLKKTEYDFWMKRLSYAGELFDIVRIDHFRAFDTYWKIPSSCPTAVEGKWVEAPGHEVFEKIQKELKNVEIVVEDLGDLRPQVLKLRDDFHLKGMKVVQFTFDPKENNNNFKDRENMIIYTGTHDNQTTRGWYESQPFFKRLSIRKFMFLHGYRYKKISHCFIQYAFSSIASIAIVPMQDIIGLSDEGRMNTPGTLGSPNWEWRMLDFKAFDENLDQFTHMIQTTGR